VDADPDEDHPRAYNDGWEQIEAGIGNFGNSGQDGFTSYTCSGGYFVATQVSTFLNTYYTDAYDTNGREQVQAHEFGHALGLGHAGALCAGIPIMYFSSDRYFTCGIVTPQQDDVNGINAIYP